ncbi:hypothetical protein GUITHDRAFT_121573 [Guillardia theta CCMP2712]|uniref:Uncharacterized protein n=1 Tax=Guillardia theta (strain CCMP2712) TaxID=905079 RepID=L1I7N7_GUITC|nr:hypothetical protein GUITHDRAFT_121573 [Guillardia theta CCMP2712]EKX32248.1 hypothetical protein GUITHDRAFT_121573 [Guillardia theta CCMP2712]|eukprot:XP_005819228.1 hypothetical protein GUITHDRAFT_121573 [Guillardia theta CCMP2712]
MSVSMAEEAGKQQMRLREMREKIEKSRSEPKRTRKGSSREGGGEEEQGLSEGRAGDGRVEGRSLKEVRESIEGYRAEERRVLQEGLKTRGTRACEGNLEGELLTYRMVLEMEMNGLNKSRLKMLAKDRIRGRHDNEDGKEIEDDRIEFGRSRSTYGRFLSRKLLVQGLTTEFVAPCSPEWQAAAQGHERGGAGLSFRCCWGGSQPTRSMKEVKQVLKKGAKQHVDFSSSDEGPRERSTLLPEEEGVGGQERTRKSQRHTRAHSPNDLTSTSSGERSEGQHGTTRRRVNPEMNKFRKFKQGKACLSPPCVGLRVIVTSDFDKRMLDLRKKLAVNAEKERKNLERESKFSDLLAKIQIHSSATRESRRSSSPSVKSSSPRRPATSLEALLDNELRRAERRSSFPEEPVSSGANSPAPQDNSSRRGSMRMDSRRSSLRRSSIMSFMRGPSKARQELEDAKEEDKETPSEDAEADEAESQSTDPSDSPTFEEMLKMKREILGEKGSPREAQKVRSKSATTTRAFKVATAARMKPPGRF